MLSTCRHATRSTSTSVTRLVSSRLVTGHGRRHVTATTPAAAASAASATFPSATATSTSTIPGTSGTGAGSDSGSGSGSGSGSNGMQPSKNRHTTTVLGTAVLAAFFTIYVTSKVQEARERKQREAELKALGIDPSTPGASTIVNKLLINSPQDVVTESIEGALLSNPGWTAIDGFPEVKVIVRADWNRHSTRQVAIISGGGDGHAPAHSGYVGDGMLTAAVSGNVFASPSVTAILAAIRTVARPHGPGVLLIVKNYTGDRLNFGIAAEQAKNEGIPVQMVIVGDDVALPRSKGITGRRGLAGTVLVHKLAGAAARNGATLQDVTQVAAQAAASVATLGVATSSCTLPGQKRTERLSGEEMEIGMGIHGESGLIRTPMTSANEIVTTLIDTLLSVDPQRDYFMTGTTSTQRQRVVLMVNNLGASTPAEINIATRHAVKLLQSRGIAVERVYAGMFMSALDMTGYSISVMRVDVKMVRLLDQTTSAPAWPTQRWTPGSVVHRPTLLPLPTSPTPSHILPAFKSPSTPTGHLLLQTLDAISQALIRAEPQLNKLDSIAGDGDCGSTHRRGAEKILSHLRTSTGLQSNLPVDDIAATMEALALSVGNTMGGSSGALYQLGLTAAARELRTIQAKKRGKEPLDAAAFVVALQAGMSAMSTYGGAQEGYRTMLDAWGPAIRTLDSALKQGQSTAQAVQAAAQAASLGADATCNLAAQAGRSNYVPDALLRQTPDPGAKAVALTWKAVADTLAIGTTPATTTSTTSTTLTSDNQ